MAGDYRITVRGALSDRFCRGLPVLRHDIADGQTVLAADAAGPRSLGEVLATLDNLGLEIVRVEAPPASEEDPNA
jgi:hypothetical protein